MFIFAANKNAFQIDITAYVTPYEWSSPYVIDKNRPLLTSYVDLLPKQPETAWVRCVFLKHTRSSIIRRPDHNWRKSVKSRIHATI